MLSSVASAWGVAAILVVPVLMILYALRRLR